MTDLVNIFICIHSVCPENSPLTYYLVALYELLTPWKEGKGRDVVCDHSGFGFTFSFCFQFSTFSPNYIWFPHIWSLSILNVIKLPFPVEMGMGYILGYTWKTKRLEKAWGVTSNCSVQMCNFGNCAAKPQTFLESWGKWIFFTALSSIGTKASLSLVLLCYLPLLYLLSLKQFLSMNSVDCSSILFIFMGYYYFSYFTSVSIEFWESKEIYAWEI